MGQLSDALGIGQLFDREGKEYEVTPIQPYHWGMLEARLRKDAWAEIDASRPYISDELLRLSVSVLQQDLASGKYDQGSQAYRAKILTPSGARYILTLLLREKHKEIDEAWVQKWIEDDGKRALRIYKLAVGIKEENDEQKEDDKKSDESAG